jgi:hypothetical protein
VNADVDALCAAEILTVRKFGHYTYSGETFYSSIGINRDILYAII